MFNRSRRAQPGESGQIENQEVAIRCLAEERLCCNEVFGGLSLTRFDRTRVIV
jgi:hypothetical protein